MEVLAEASGFKLSSRFSRDTLRAGNYTILTEMVTKREVGLPDYRWALLGLVVFCLLVYLLSPILSPFLTAAILAYISNPLVERLERWKLGRTCATLLVMLVLAG